MAGLTKKYMVTGGAGFIGSHIVDTLVEKGFDVVIVDNLSTGKTENINPKAVFCNLDIRNLEDIKPVFKGIDCVFHLAAQPRIQPSIIDPLASHSNNVVGIMNVLLAARDAGVKKFVYSASSAAYGDQDRLPLTEDMIPRPKTPYSLFKLAGEEYCKLFSMLYNLPTVSLRYFNVYGPRQLCEGAYSTVIGVFLKQKKEGRPLTIVGNGEISRDFTHVRDVVRANLLAMESDKVGKGEVINIGAGSSHTVNEIAAFIGSNTINIPPRPGEARITLADTNRAKELLGWKSTITVEEGINELKKIMIEEAVEELKRLMGT